MIIVIVTKFINTVFTLGIIGLFLLYSDKIIGRVDKIIEYLYENIFVNKTKFTKIDIVSDNNSENFESKQNGNLSVDIESSRLIESNNSIKLTETKQEQIDKTLIQKLLLESVKSHDLSTFNKLVDSGAELEEKIIIQAISSKSYQIIDFINSFNNSFDFNCLNLALSLNNIPMINYLLERGCKWTIYSFSFGISSLDINLLEYIKSKGCYWGILHEKHINIVKSHNNISQWLKLNGCQWNELNVSEEFSAMDLRTRFHV